MSLPADPAERAQLLIEWANGNADAADFLSMAADICRAADDAVDGDHGPRIEKVCELLHAVLIRAPGNAFLALHWRTLAPVVNEMLVYWSLSEEWREQDEKAKMFAFVHREASDRLLIAVAMIVGGREHAMKCMRDLFDRGHRGGETFKKWKG